MSQVVNIFPHKRQRPVYFIVNIMTADHLAPQGARVLAATILTNYVRVNLGSYMDLKTLSLVCAKMMSFCNSTNFLVFQWLVNHIIMTSYERQGVWNHWQLDCFFNHLFRETRKNTKPWITALCEGNPPGHQWKAFPRHYVIMNYIQNCRLR